MKKYKLVVQNTFKKSYKKLPKLIQKALRKKLEVLIENPFHVSLRTKINHKWTKFLKVKSFESSINMNYRIIWIFDENENNIIILVATGDHKVVE